MNHNNCSLKEKFKEECEEIKDRLKGTDFVTKHNLMIQLDCRSFFTLRDILSDDSDNK